ncbi:RsmB/NOP family class I SAM-dependent RNA methyltransferase [Candidatus Woesearchaeota archaeon]|nr:RsmB/NOP family class I SAM-dependent RNA methyltransferase [Candidatus Woesearchaeota archaeon]
MPDSDKIEIKEAFRERYSSLTDWDEFIKYSLSFLRRSIRVNTLKISVPELKKRLEKNWNLEQIPWCAEGFWVEHKGEEKRRDIGNTLEHQLGYIYVQEAASMIPPIVLEPKPGEIILDMCASPGSKAGQIAQYMENKGVIIANDYKGIRLAPLGINMQRISALNSIITLMDGSRFSRAGISFDRVLLDVPCSGTGTIRKSLKTLRIWNPNMLKKIASEQKRLLEAGFSALKKNGILVYSTCSLEPEEDEGVIDYFLKKHEDAFLEEFSVDGLKKGKIIESFDGTEYSEEVRKCLRLWPQDNDTEGFFIARIRKI